MDKMQNAKSRTGTGAETKPVSVRLGSVEGLVGATEAAHSLVSDPQQLVRIIRHSLKHLFLLIDKDGRFVYAHVKGDTERQFDGYNMLRHCGTVWFMCTAIAELKVETAPWQAQLLGKAVNYVLRKLAEPTWVESEAPCLCLVTRDRVKLGGNGLALLMLRQYVRLQATRPLDFPALTHAPADLTEKLENYIVSQVEGADFIHKRRFSDGTVSSFRSDYYTGEALYGLFSGASLTAKIRHATTTLMQGGYGIAIQSHWMAYAACEAARHHLLAPDLLAPYISTLMTSIIEDDSYRSRRQSTPIACRSEALGVCLNTIRNVPELRHRLSPALVTSAEQCMVENLTLQLNWYTDGQFWKGDDEDKVQIDYIQHNAASFLSWYSYIQNDRPTRLLIVGREEPSLGSATSGGVTDLTQINLREIVARPDFADLQPNDYDVGSSCTGQNLIDREFARLGFGVRSFGEISRLSKDGRAVFTHSAETSFTSWLGSKVLKRKELGKQLMELAGARTAEGRVFEIEETDKARRYVRLMAPCVVKPVDGNLSRGVTVNVDPSNFRKAWEDARQHTSSGIIIEKYVRGREARYLVVDNRCVAVLQETPPFVTGDGKHSIAELVERKSALRKQNPFLRSYPLVLDDAKKAYLAQYGIDAETVPMKGEQVALNDTDLLDGGDTVDITDYADEGLKRIAENITRFLPGLDVIGFDVIALDHSAPNGGGDFIFLEGNTRPDILEHHFPAFGSVRNVARDIAVSCSRRVSLSLPRDRSIPSSNGTPSEKNIYSSDAVLNPSRDLTRRFRSAGFSTSWFGRFLMVEKGKRRALIHGTESCFTSRLGVFLLRDTVLVRTLLRDAGISVPEARLISRDQRQDAHALICDWGMAVIRPVEMPAGPPISWTVTKECFDAIWLEALEEIDGDVLLEKHSIKATSVRYIVIDGLMQAAIQRPICQVTGDGKSTLRQLCESKQVSIPSEAELACTRHDTGAQRAASQSASNLDPDSVPAPGERVILDAQDPSVWEQGLHIVTDQVHPGFRDIVERAYHALPDLHFMEIEILAEDHSLAPSPGTYAVATVSRHPDPASAFDPSFREISDINAALVQSCLRRFEDGRQWPEPPEVVDFEGVQPPVADTALLHQSFSPSPLGESPRHDSIAFERWVPGDRPLPVLRLKAQRFGDAYKLAFVGDFAFGESYQVEYERKGRGNILKSRGYASCLTGVDSLLRSADQVVANLETPLTRLRVSPLAGRKTWLHWGDPEATARHLQGYNFGTLSIANNHSLDYGWPGLSETIDALQGAGHVVIGGGPDLDRASQPVVMEIQLGDRLFDIVLIAAYDASEGGDDAEETYAGTSRSGVCPLDPEVIEAQIERVRKERPGCFAIVLPHWGRNYRWRTDRQRIMARALINAGADMIIGHGSHMLQEVERINGKWVLFSLGNFVFNSLGRYAKFSAPPYSLVARLVISPSAAKDGPTCTLQVLPIVTDNRQTAYRTRTVTADEFRDVMTLLDRRMVAGRLSDQSIVGQDPDGSWYFQLAV
jgi:poly-gamma-glutamate capsule biosynthesis protein CapA/YwtB (metallophosphatase superfamily)/D-alanine-D-alanine ligase-like ATP-grasp enzyme